MDKQQSLLEQLHGLQAPVVSGLPAIGWWFVAALIGMAVYAFRVYKKNYQQRYWYREAMLEINMIRSAIDQQSHHSLLMRCSELARKLVLVGMPRAEFAGTIGEQWLQQLDAICGEPVFSHGAGKLLVQAPYQPNPQVAASDISELSDSLECLAAAMLRRRKRDE